MCVLKGKVTKRHMERGGMKGDEEISHPLVHSMLGKPSGQNGQGYPGMKPEARNSIQVFHMDCRSQRTWIIFCCSPGHISKELDQKQSN